MPIYEYRCETCGHELEAMQKMVDEPLKDCPDCGQSTLRKKISAVGFRLKGSGWYETDFKTGNKKNIAKDEAAPTESSKSDSAKADGGKAEASKSESSKANSNNQAA